MHHVVLTEAAAKLLRRHVLNYFRDGRVVVGSFEAIPGLAEAEVAAGYAELVDAGLMHRGRPAGAGDPGTFLLSSLAIQDLP